MNMKVVFIFVFGGFFMRFKKALAFAFVFAVIFLNAFSKDIKKASGSKLKVVATVFPEYDWAREIIGQKSDEAELSLLLENGVDLHSYSPSVADIAKIHESDIFIYVGGESDGWVRDVLKSSGNKETLLVNLLETLGDNAKEEELVEGMQKEADENAAGLELDEHVWLSLKNARVFCEAICAALCKKDSKNSSAYQKNSAAYVEKLSALDEQFARVSSETQKRVLLFGDRFPFRYLFDDNVCKYLRTIDTAAIFQDQCKPGAKNGAAKYHCQKMLRIQFKRHLLKHLQSNCIYCRSEQCFQPKTFSQNKSSCYKERQKNQSYT